MTSLRLPIVVGAGSQEGEGADYLPMPHEMATFRMPPIPEPTAGLAEARQVLLGLREEMRAWRFGEGAAPSRDLAGLVPPAIKLLNESLGQGEVSVLVRGDRELRIQETAFASVWRIQTLDAAGRITGDVLEAGPIPEVVRDALIDGTSSSPLVIGAPPAGYMNSPPILHEVAAAAQAWRPGASAHVVNLTLLPVNQDDQDHLAATLGVGPVTILSRGYGNCRITSSALRNVWWVRYYNSMDTLILDTIEVVGVPDAALAAREDFEDSIERLGEWITMLTEARA